MDENYHIADVDDIEEETSSIGEIKRKEKPVIKTKIIYENSDSSDEKNERKDMNSASISYEAREKAGYKDSFDKNRFYEEDHSNSTEDEDRRFNDGFESSGHIKYDFDEDDYREEKNCGSSEKIFDEKAIVNLYRKRPNTFKGTIIGIILALLILWIGFLKTLLIFIVVLLANIIGQFLDGNPRLLSVFDSISRKFR
ncbi:MAG: hypothetical protein PEPC_00942 [Peptostreptococcus russellii]